VFWNDPKMKSQGRAVRLDFSFQPYQARSARLGSAEEGRLWLNITTEGLFWWRLVWPLRPHRS
jgi:hypothetical protein